MITVTYSPSENTASLRRTFLCMAVLLVSFAAKSQDTLAINSNAKSAAIVSRISRELGLTGQQRSQVQAILQERWNSLTEARATSRSVDHASTNQKALREIKKVLTPQQYDLLLALQKERRQQKKEFLEQHPEYTFSKEDKDLDF